MVCFLACFFSEGIHPLPCPPFVRMQTVSMMPQLHLHNKKLQSKSSLPFLCLITVQFLYSDYIIGTVCEMFSSIYKKILMIDQCVKWLSYLGIMQAKKKRFSKILQVPLVSIATCNYPMTEYFYAMIDGTFWKKEIKRILLGENYIADTMLRNKQHLTQNLQGGNQFT